MMTMLKSPQRIVAGLLLAIAIAIVAPALSYLNQPGSGLWGIGLVLGGVLFTFFALVVICEGETTWKEVQYTFIAGLILVFLPSSGYYLSGLHDQLVRSRQSQIMYQTRAGALLDLEKTIKRAQRRANAAQKVEYESLAKSEFMKLADVFLYTERMKAINAKNLGKSSNRVMTPEHFDAEFVESLTETLEKLRSHPGSPP